MTFLSKLCRDQDGATAIEYGLIAALIAIAAVAAMTSVGGQLQSEFNITATTLSSANS